MIYFKKYHYGIIWCLEERKDLYRSLETIRRITIIKWSFTKSITVHMFEMDTLDWDKDFDLDELIK